MPRLRPRSGYDVLALVAFFISVAGGGAYAAATIGAGDIRNNAVHSNHITDGEVKSADLAPNSVGSGKVIDGTLLRQDFKAGQLPRGAVSFDTHLGDGKHLTMPAVNGVVLLLICNTASDAHVEIELDPKGAPTVIVSGTQAIDAVLAGARFSGARYPISTGGSSVDANVLARIAPGGKWVRFQVAAGFAGPGNGCNFASLIMPPSN